MNNSKPFEWTETLIREFAEWYRKTQGNCSAEMWGKDLFEEFKKSKEVKKDYEIQSFYDNYKNVITWTSGGKFGMLNFHEWVEDCLKLQYEIHSVKRLSDGVTFSIGDITNFGKIEKFHLYNKEMIAEFEGGMRSAHFNNLQKVEPKQKLFTCGNFTIYEGDDVWCVNGGYFVFVKYGITKVIYDDLKYHCQFFKTEKEANDWVVWNKPQLSLSEVMSISDWYDGESFFERRLFEREKLIKISTSKTLNP